MTVLGTRAGTLVGTQIGFRNSAFELLLAVTGILPVFTPGYYILDPASGRVYAFVDWKDPTHLLVQANPSFQVAPPQPHSAFNGALCVERLTTENYVSNRSTAYWAAWNSGAGNELWAVATFAGTGTNYRIHTTSGFTGPGFGLGTTGSSALYQVKIPAGDTVNISFSTSPSNSFAKIRRCKYLEGGSPEALLEASGFATNTQASAFAADATAPASPLRWGWSGGSTNERIAAIVCAPSLSDSAATQVREALKTMYGEAL